MLYFVYNLCICNTYLYLFYVYKGINYLNISKKVNKINFRVKHEYKKKKKSRTI